jgi:hypothetical protein
MGFLAEIAIFAVKVVLLIGIRYENNRLYRYWSNTQFHQVFLLMFDADEFPAVDLI